MQWREWCSGSGSSGAAISVVARAPNARGAGALCVVVTRTLATRMRRSIASAAAGCRAWAAVVMATLKEEVRGVTPLSNASSRICRAITHCAPMLAAHTAACTCSVHAHAHAHAMQSPEWCTPRARRLHGGGQSRVRRLWHARSPR